MFLLVALLLQALRFSVIRCSSDVVVHQESGSGINGGSGSEESLANQALSDPGSVCVPSHVQLDCSSLLWRKRPSCDCGSNIHGIVVCENNKQVIGILRCYCIYNDSTGYYVGNCFYGCFIRDHHHNYTKLYHPYSTDDDIVNNLCSHWGRQGPLCGECDSSSSSIAAYSFSLECRRCNFHWTNIVRYIGIAYGPLTLFFLILLLFTVSIHSAPLHGYIFVAQMIATSYALRLLQTLNEVGSPPKAQVVSVAFTATVYGVWNLDFFRFVNKHFCLHPSLSTLSTISLDYMIAAYPFIVLIITYTLVIQHSKGCRLLVLIWRLFHKLFGRFRENLDIKTSLVDAFGTFFSLSYVKFLSTTVDLMAATRTWDVNGKKLSTRVYFDASLKFMEGTHLYYAVLALSCLLIFNILPLILLLLYPRRFFQKRLSLSVRHFLHPLMDTLLGIYRDGTDGGADCRYFVVVYPIARMAMFSVLLMTQNSFCFLLITALTIITAVLVVVIKPYKSNTYNMVDAILVGVLALVYASLTSFFFSNYVYSPGLPITRVALPIFISLPFFYACGLTLYWTWVVCKLRRKLPQMGKSVVQFCWRVFFSVVDKLKRKRYEMQNFPSLNERSLLIPPAHRDMTD